MVKSYTAKYSRLNRGYMGQLVEWPEVITEGKTIEECREMLRDALKEMILAYKQQGRELPISGDLVSRHNLVEQAPGPDRLFEIEQLSYVAGRQ